MGWARAKRFNTKVVTLDGEIVHAGGRLTGGKTGQGQDNLLGRERELRKLAAQTGQLAEQEQEQAQRLTEQENELAAAEQRREKLASESHQLAIELQNVRVGAKRAAEELARLRQERDRLQTERRTCELEMEKYREKIDQARERLTHLRQALAEAQLGAQDRHDSLAALRRRRETIGERLNELHVQLATARQAQMSLQERLTELRQEKATHEAAHKACQERSAQIRARLADLGREVDVLAKKRTEAQAALGGVEERLQRLQAHQAALAEQRLDWEREIKRLRTRAETAQRYIHAWEVEIARLQAMVEHVHERLASLGAADAEREPVGDREQRAARIVELQELLEGLGPVNPKAVAEFEAVSERYRFLRKQELDLEQAKGMMHRIIGDMDRQIANRFRQTFAAVQGHFRAIFPRLFTGGQADLVLTDPDNPLDSGVEIVAQPPGKRLTSLLLLSGGERALTAIALLFALLKARPSPFCVLDEIDASLDDANLERFIRFLRSYAEETQFIIITHQKATMEAADSLYGVTMQELGVSRLVSVRLAEAS
jgi:chromosome segregation protein